MGSWATSAVADVAAALDRLDGPFGVFVRVAASTGGRRGQLVGLQWCDVDVDGGRVTFRRAIVDGGPGVGLVVQGTKTGRSWRVALDAGTVGALRAHRAAMAARALSVGVPLAEGAWVFSDDPACRTPWRPDSTSARWRRLRGQVGLEGVPLRALRHMVATELLADGVDVRTVAGRLGHATPALTLSTYAAWMPEADRRAADRMGALLEQRSAVDE